ncbi:MAG: hypothetical protein J6Z27_02105 [Bacteroidales bacterium]|nr:hypothetical protein [Bacteroidales bacterium]
MRKLLFTLLLCLIVFSASGQDYGFKRTSVIELGLGTDRYIDKATSSAVMWDLLISEKYLLATENDRILRFFTENANIGFHSLQGGFYLNLMNFSVTANVGYAWTYNLVGDRHDSFRLWAGGSANDHLDIRVNRAYFPTVSNFLFLGGDVVLQYSFGRYSLSSFIKVPLVSLVTRPSYAIIGPSVTQMDDVATYFKSFESSFRGFGGASFDLGFCWKTKKENPLRVSYRWEYFSTGRGSSWDFKEGTHSLTFSVKFKEKTRLQ